MFKNDAAAKRALSLNTVIMSFEEQDLHVNMSLCFDEFLKLVISKIFLHLFAYSVQPILQAQPVSFDCIVVSDWHGAKLRPN